MEEEQRILDFLSDKMTDAEKQTFLKEIEVNEDLREAVEHSRNIRNILSKDRNQFSQAIRETIDENRQEKSNSFYWIAASVSILVIFFAVYLLQTNTSTLPVLADQYLEPHKDMLTSRSGGDIQIDLSDYKKGDYKQAIVSLEKQLNVNYQSITALYLGVSYLLENDPSRANDVFAGIDKDQVVFNDDVAWYQSLALIKLNRMEEARTLLIFLVEKNTVYQKRAEELLSLME